MDLVGSKRFSRYKIRSNDMQLSIVFENIIAYTRNTYGCEWLFRGLH